VPTSSPKLELYVEQGKLRYCVSRGSLTPALKQLLSEHKDVLVAALAPPPAGHSEPSPGPAPQNSHNPQNATTPAHCEDSGDCGHPFGSAPADRGLTGGGTVAVA
jgi:hypothetical protein